MRLRRRSRARHLAEEDEDLVIDLRERLAPYGQPDTRWDDEHRPKDAAPPPARRPRPLRRR